MTERLVVRVEYLGHETGLWCQTCALSTGVSAHIAVHAGSQMPTISSDSWCVECRGRDVDPLGN